ncbi:unnamed protein product [Eruca vesicaria subsp. sativa]|uniref:RBR-type E3 ubiquitin transferase n=1 Tax=Eruca vesicaria subsp. sativa TaxID=29727 RepID=A0ABC8JYG0_ERUVS|nr:unnamed protein product [Eruca vesicaria subsp. sativa]
MEDDLKRPYSVCTRDDLKEKMNQQINAISEIFCVSNSDATVLLMKLRWNSELLQETLTEDKKKLLMESGLTYTVQDLSGSTSSSCDEFYEFFDDDDNDDDDDEDVKISTPFCSHKFSITYWSKYLKKNFFALEKTLDTISCPHHNCEASVGRDTITAKDKDCYDEYVLRSYLENKKQIKQCPACSYFIEFHRDAEECGLNVVCLCGHTFCWRCRLESHAPVTCNNASDWLVRDLKKLSLNETNTKPCPHCQTPLEIVSGSLSSRFMSCVNCSGYYCWLCMKSQESHDSESEACGDYVEPKAELDISCFERFELSLVKAKSLLTAFEESNNMVLREGLMLIVQCRQFLKWSCVYEYIHLEHEDSKKEFLRFLRDYANKLVRRYARTLKKETRKVTCSKGNLSAVTSSIGNYFYNFSKALKDGLDVVEVKHYDDFSPCWLCDRCTYANTWLHKESGLGEDKDKLLSESGLSSLITNHVNDDDDDGLISTPCCSHKFCKTCWREYLDSLEKNQTIISCPHQNCLASVGPDTIKNLTEKYKDFYESYILRSYIEENKGLMIKNCPARDCNYVIEFHQPNDVEEFGLNVVCLCGHTFCWRCSFESHRPVTCNNVSDWLSTEVEVSVVDRWEERKVAMEGAQDDLQDFEDYITKNPDSLKEQDVRIVREGLMLLVQCRQVLKWTCVYEYFHTEHETSKKEYLQFLQDIAMTTLQSYLKTLLEETETAFYAADALVVCKFRHNLNTATSNVGNFFYHFIKTLQDGIVDVKVKSYDNVAGPYWLCDRCTYGNSWLDMKCKMCCEATTSKA